MKINNKYNHWMEVETAYALTKFPSVAQYPYFISGVTRGNASFQSNASGYLRRARIFEPEAKAEREIGLRLVQSLGKAAHSLVALHSTAESYWNNGKKQIAAAMATFSEVAEKLDIKSIKTGDSLDAAITKRSEVFGRLQVLQDEERRTDFSKLLMTEIIVASEVFVGNAEEYGWPVPGRASGDIQVWM